MAIGATIGLVATRLTPPPEFNTPAEGAGAGAGRSAAAAGRVMADIAAAGASSGNLVGAAVVIGAVVAAPFAIGGSALVGALRAEPAAAVQEATKTLLVAWSELNPQGTVRDEVFRLAGVNRSPYALILLPDPLERPQVDFVLEIDVLSMRLRGDGEIDPSFTLAMNIGARLTDRDGTKLDEWTVESETTRYKFVRWAENDAALLREHAARAARVVGATIAKRFREDCRIVGASCRR